MGMCDFAMHKDGTFVIGKNGGKKDREMKLKKADDPKEFACL
jgi:hypothetical protein